MAWVFFKEPKEALVWLKENIDGNYQCIRTPALMPRVTQRAPNRNRRIAVTAVQVRSFHSISGCTDCGGYADPCCQIARHQQEIDRIIRSRHHRRVRYAHSRFGHRQHLFQVPDVLTVKFDDIGDWMLTKLTWS